MAELERIAQGAMLKRAEHDTLAVIFSSRIAPSLVEFDFMRFATTLDCQVLLVRDDTERYYYHAGIAGLGSRLDDTCASLRAIQESVSASRMVTMGSSWGGHGAVLYGQLLDVDAVIAVNALSFLDPALALRKGGGQRIPGSFRTMRDYYAVAPGPIPWLDLREVIAMRGDRRPPVRWHFGQGDWIDTLHALHIQGAEGIELVAHSGKLDHGRLIASMLFSGVLQHEIESRYGRPSGPLAPDEQAASDVADEDRSAEPVSPTSSENVKSPTPEKK